MANTGLHVVTGALLCMMQTAVLRKFRRELPQSKHPHISVGTSSASQPCTAAPSILSYPPIVRSLIACQDPLSTLSSTLSSHCRQSDGFSVPLLHIISSATL